MAHVGQVPSSMLPMCSVLQVGVSGGTATSPTKRYTVAATVHALKLGLSSPWSPSHHPTCLGTVWQVEQLLLLGKHLVHSVAVSRPLPTAHQSLTSHSAPGEPMATVGV